MITTFNRKLLEKQRIQNHFASYEKHISHFFLQCQCYCQFWKSFNPDYIQISKIFTGLTDRLTDRLTHDKTDCLKPLCACAHRVLINHYPFLIFIKLQKASTDTLKIKNSHWKIECVLSKSQPISVYRQSSSSEPEESQQMAAYELVGCYGIYTIMQILFSFA